jgi:hypothetical protein
LNVPTEIVRFSGPVRAVSGPAHAGITLLGKIVEPDGALTAAQLSLNALEPVHLAQILRDVTVEALPAQDVLLRSGAQEWRVRCRTWQLHRDVGTVFYAAIPPRPTPWTRRLGWRLLLAFAASGPGRWLLARVSGAR